MRKNLLKIRGETGPNPSLLLKVFETYSKVQKLNPWIDVFSIFHKASGL